MSCSNCGTEDTKKIEFCSSCWSLRGRLDGFDEDRAIVDLPYYSKDSGNELKMRRSKHTVEVTFQIGDSIRSVVCVVYGSIGGFDTMFSAVNEASYILTEESSIDEEGTPFYKRNGDVVFIDLMSEDQVIYLESHVVSCRFLFFSELTLL